MKRDWFIWVSVCLGILALGTTAAQGQSTVSIVGWGRQVVIEEAALDSLIAVAGGSVQSLGLKSDGTIVAWGWNAHGECSVPSPNDNFIAVAGGYYHSLGLKSDGTIVAWGYNGYGQCNVPSPNANFIAVAAGTAHSLGLKSDRRIVAWGTNDDGECNVPSPNANFIAVAGGWDHSLAAKYSSITGIQEREPGHAPRATGLAILSVLPNPFNPCVGISFERRGLGQVTLEIYDVSGRCIRTVTLGILGPGFHRARWDGRDASGHNVSSGIYFVRLRGAEGQSPAVKAVLIR